LTATCFAERTLQMAIEACLDVASHVIADRGLRVPSTYAETFEILVETGLMSSDLGHVRHGDPDSAGASREHGIRRIYTRDTDFHRFPFIEVLDPLTAPR